MCEREGCERGGETRLKGKHKFYELVNTNSNNGIHKNNGSFRFEKRGLKMDTHCSHERNKKSNIYINI